MSLSLHHTRTGPLCHQCPAGWPHSHALCGSGRYGRVHAKIVAVTNAEGRRIEHIISFCDRCAFRSDAGKPGVSAQQKAQARWMTRTNAATYP